eukprot:TRINITY_DN8763_c0_g1_i1.p1 TRINITY_DN8763_c0_g1~~TRINITY_DN8763_c0_g1_i1.p1  ORF type:complete len:385 (-),score=85.48 TRINITY_DN8763_c0_g1_i1:126-1280(-)
MGLVHPVRAKVQEKYGNEFVRVGTCSMQGKRPEMEDRHTVRLSLAPCHPNKALFAVFDGHCGKAAANFCAEQLHQRIANSQTSLEDQDLISLVHQLDLDFIAKDEVLRNHGSTLVFAVVDFEQRPYRQELQQQARQEDEEDGKMSVDDNDHEPTYAVTIVNVGDSRVLWGTLREGADPSWLPCTVDHKPSDEKERDRIVKAGGYVAQSRVDGNLALSRAIGDFVYKRNESLPAEQQKVIPTPDITRITVKKDDWLLIACDGIFEQWDSKDVASHVSERLQFSSGNPVAVCEELCDVATVVRHSGDNTSAVTVFFQDGTEWLKQEGHAEHRWFVDGPMFPDSARFMQSYRQFAEDSGFPERAPALENERTDDQQPSNGVIYLNHY